MKTRHKNKGTREKKEVRIKSNQKINTPSKNQYGNRPKTAKNNNSKTISAEKIQRKPKKDKYIAMQQTEYKQNLPHKNKFKDHYNDNNNMNISESYNKKQINTINDNNNDYPYSNDKKKTRNDMKMTESQNTKDDNINTFNRNNITFFNNINNDNNEDPFCSGSKKKSRLIYSEFIDNLKDKVSFYENYNHKRKKNAFSHFLDQFVNVNESAPPNTTTKNIFDKLKSNYNKHNSPQIPVFNNITTNNVINLFFKGSSNNNNNIKIIENKYISEIRKLEKELEIKNNKINEMIKALETNNNEIIKNKEMEIKDSKINELLNEIETQKKEMLKINNKYNEIIQENEQLKIKYNEIMLENQQLKNKIMLDNQTFNNKYNEIILENQKIKDKQNEILLENQKLKEEINNLNEIKKKEIQNNINIKKIESNSNIENDSYNKEKPQSQINNLITYNINKNNNYNIINSEINNFNNYLKNNININNNIKNEPKVEKERKSLKDRDVNKETEQERKERKERKASQAFERFKRMNKQNSVNKDGEAQKSNKISLMAKMLEKQMGAVEPKNKERNNSTDVVRNNGGFNHIIDIIDSQPVISKKKKKIRSFSCDD